jgi:glycosyltransferase involved in cell wall biosynthesis
VRIAFDGTTLRPERTGVGYYTEHLLEHLARQHDGELVVVSNRTIDTTAPLPGHVRVAVPAARLPRMAWMQMVAPRTLRELHADVAHFTNGMVPIASSVPSVVTIHDMSLTMYPAYHPLRRVLLNRPLVDIAARRATAVITVSESARRDIVRIYALDPSRVHVVHEAAAPAFRPVCDLAELNRVRRRYGLGDRVILYVGTIEPRKNLPRLIDAFAVRRRAGDLTHQLVCVGRYGWRSRGIGARIEHARVADAIAFTGYVPFGDLPALYNLAEMFVFPSLHEGFGLPVVEAMACGVPVIAGTTSSLPEVGGGAVEHVDPQDEDALGEAMVRLARSRERRDALATLGLRRARTFSWDRAARETLDVYRQVAKHPAGAVRVEAPPALAAGVAGVAGVNVGLEPAPGSHAVRESRQPWAR